MSYRIISAHAVRTACAVLAVIAGYALPAQAQTVEQNAPGIQMLDAGQVEAPLSESALYMAQQGVPLKSLLASQKTVNDRVFALSMRANPEVAAIMRREKSFMGTIKAAIDSTVIQVVKDNYPELIQDLAIHYDRAFTEEERGKLVQFFDTSSGKALIASAMAPSDSTVLERMMNDTDHTLTIEEMNEILGDFRARAIDRLAPDDKRTVAEFLESPLGQKYAKSFDEEDRITLNWVNGNNASLPPLVNNAVQSAAERYINAGRK